MLSMKAMSYHIMVWKISGLWTLPGNPVWYRVYSKCICIIFYVIYPLWVAVQIMFVNSFDEKIEVLLILPTACAGIKCFFVILKRRELCKLFELINKMDEFAQETEHSQVIDKATVESMFLVKMLSVFYYLTVFSSFMIAYLSEERRFMWKSYFPFGYKNNLGIYYSCLSFQLVASYFLSFIYSSLDLYGSALYKMLGAHIDILGEKFKILGRPKNEVDLDWDRPRRIDEDLKACVMYHNLCIQYSNCLNSILSYPLMFQFGTSGLVFCGSEFRISTLDPVTQYKDFMFIFMYIVSMSYQIYIPCHFGNIVKQKSDKLLHQLIESDWLDGRRSMRRAILIIGERARHPIVPFAGGLFAVDLPTFVSIMKSAYSLMAFLKNVEGQQ